MLEVLLSGGTVIDGTGGPPKSADVGIADGRLVISSAGSQLQAATVVDATGLFIVPGFIDPHTHYDAQLLWDPHASPSNLHGVTTIIGGNCGFGLAPVHAADRDATLADFAVTEGMPLDSLRRGVEWSWEGVAKYFDTLGGRLAVNAGFLVPHCALRHFVMGQAATERAADKDEIASMVDLLLEALDAGALGFSTSRGPGHVTHTGVPVASRWATDDEVIALCAAVGDRPGTCLELTLAGVLTRFSAEEEQFLVDMSVSAQRPLNWNMLYVEGEDDQERVEYQLRASRQAREQGGRVTALTFPGEPTMTEGFGAQSRLRTLPGFKDFVRLSVAERVDRLSDPDFRRDLVATARAPGSPGASTFASLLDFSCYLVGDTYSPKNEGLHGRMVGDIAEERGVEPFDVVADIAAHDDMRTVFWPQPVSPPACWDLRAQVWQDEDVLIGGSDAGAHLDRLCGASYPTELLADVLRGRRLLSVEEAVHQLTAAPADFFGLHRKGRIAEGYDADLVLLDPQTVASGTPYSAHDLPAGGLRLTADAVGIARVFVGGVETLADGVPTDGRPGQVLRSGRDTVTSGS